MKKKVEQLELKLNDFKIIKDKQLKLKLPEGKIEFIPTNYICKKFNNECFDSKCNGQYPNCPQYELSYGKYFTIQQRLL